MQKTQDMLKNQFNALGESLKKLWNSNLFKVYLVLFAAACFALFFEPAAIVLFCGVAIVCCFLNVSDTFGMLMFFYPFFSVFMFKGKNLYFFLFAVVILILAAKYLFEVYKKKQKIDWLLIGLVAGYLVYLLLPIRQTEWGNFKSGCGYEYFFTAGVFFACLYLVYKQKEKIDFLKCFHLLVIGYLLAGCLGWFAYVSSRLQAAMTFVDYTGISLVRFNGLFGFPNTLAIVGLFISAGLFYLQYNKKIGKEVYLYQTGVFALSYLTLARSFLYAYFGGFVLFAVAVIIKHKKQAYKILLPNLACILVVMLALFPYTKEHFGRASVSDLVNGYDGAASSENLEQFSDPGRGGLIKIFLKDFLSSIMVVLFGRGLSATNIGGTRNLSSHNTYLQALWNTGIVGVALFVLVLVIFIKKYSALKWKPLIKSTFADFGNYVLLLPILAMMFIETIFMNMQMIVVVLIVMFVISGVKLQKTEQVESQRKPEEKIDTKTANNAQE